MASASRPDVLVLAAGGVLGEAWMSGVLAGVEDATGIDFRGCDAYVGTSAGSIVAAHLVAGERPRRPRDVGGPGAPPSDLARDAPPPRTSRARALGPARAAARIGAWATTPLVPPLLALGTPAAARLRALALARAPDRGERLTALHRQIERLGARFDGRLRVCCVDRASGRRVVFGRPGAPHASVADAVTASCAIPWVFRPVRIGDREYVDGGAWSLTNLDTTPAGRDTEVLCLNPSGGTELALSSLMGTVRAVAAAAGEVETLALRARGARVRTISPNAAAAARMGANFMDARPATAVHLAGYRQGLTCRPG